MEINKKICGIFCYVVASILLSGFFIYPCAAKDAQKIAVLPFTMNTKEDLAFLQKGIFDMFSSRITFEEEVKVLTRENLETMLKDSPYLDSLNQGLNETTAKQLGGFLNVDYVLFGSLTLFGNSMSLDVSMIDIKKNTPTLTFFRKGTDPGAVIPELDKVAEEINFKVFGRQTEEFQSLAAMQKGYLPEDQAVYFNPLVKGMTLLEISGEMHGMAIGDVDGDGRPEVVITYNQMIEIYKPQAGGKLMPFQKIENDSAALEIIGIDAADINNNGYAEIFVTRINPIAKTVKSYVIEYNGNKLVPQSETYPWYFRVLKDEKGKGTLYAQESIQNGGPYDPKRVFTAEWKNKGYVEGQEMKVPKGFSVMSLTSGKMFVNKPQSLVFTDRSGRLVFFDDSGNTEWVSDDGYGGSTLSFPISTANKISDQDSAFFQPRNTMFDVDSDGNEDLIVIKNNESSGYLLKNTRKFKNGQIEFLGWDESGLSSLGLPKKISGLITSMEIGDYDNNSKAELLVAVVQDRGSFLSSQMKSRLIAYDISLAKKKQPVEGD